MSIQQSINQAVGVASLLGTQTAEYKRKQELKGLEAEAEGIRKGGQAISAAGLSKSALMDKQREAMARNIEKRINIGGVTPEKISKFDKIQGARAGQAQELKDTKAYASDLEIALQEAQLDLIRAREEKMRKRSVFQDNFMRNFEEFKAKGGKINE